MTKWTPSLFVLPSLLLLLACGEPKVRTTTFVCPAPGETAEDCPWAGIARDLIDTRDVHAVIQHEADAIVGELERDALHPKLLGLWGRAVNFNQLPAGGFGEEAIVAPAIVDELATLARVDGREGRTVHAGVQHTYGYLFSLLATPYGWKRARWVKPSVNEGFGLPASTIAPVPVAGTLLGNATYLAGSIAFAGEPEWAIARGARELVAPAVIALDSSALHVSRLTETVAVGARTIVLRTDFVDLPHPAANTTLLIYSVHDSADGHSRLITAFPITAASRDKYASAPLGERVPITTQYNAWVDGLTGTTVLGSRTRQ